MLTIIANYDEPSTKFDNLWEPNCQQRILLWHGAAGYGKTHLFKHCLGRMPHDIPYVPIKLKRTSVTITEIFHRFVQYLGRENLPHLALRVAELTGTPSIKIDHNTLIGFNNQITVSLSMNNPEEQEQRRIALLEALFTDLATWPNPILVAFDKYEDASLLVAEWIEGPFLARVPLVQPLRVLIAGQRVPDPYNIEWGSNCHYQELLGVPEGHHWLPVVKELNRQIRSLDWLDGVCYALGGHPFAIVEAIRQQPLREVGT